MEAKKTIEDRIEEFSQKVRDRAEGEYPPEMVNDFLDYWTEYNEGGNKFRAEREKIFHIGKRLGRWFSNSRGKYKKLNIEENDDFKELRGKYGLE